MSRAAAVLSVGLLAWGCASDRAPQPPPEPAAAEAPAPVDEHVEKARREIHPGNVDEELEKLRRELGGS